LARVQEERYALPLLPAGRPGRTRSMRDGLHAVVQAE
jgi:hypothetical protein